MSIGAVLEELKRRKAAGEAGVFLSDETWERLRGTRSRASDDTVRAEISGEAQSERDRPMLKPVVNKRTAKQGSAMPEPPFVELPEGDKRTRWEWLRERVQGCEVCNGHVRPGKQVVFGVGNLEAKIFFCGEAPGAEEEVQGEPFVGRAGQLLTKIIEAMGLTRGEVYIGNIMNWRPEMPTEVGNRPPTQEEMAFCLPYLRAQVEVVQPKVLVALGATAVNGLLGPDPNRRMGQVRGTWSDFEGIPLMITYHPSYLLRNGSMRTKRTVWEDMLRVMERVGLPISEKQRGYFTR